MIEVRKTARAELTSPPRGPFEGLTARASGLLGRNKLLLSAAIATVAVVPLSVLVDASTTGDIVLVPAAAFATALLYRLVESVLGRQEAENELTELGVRPGGLLQPAVKAELARARRYNRRFALVVAHIHELRRRFDFRRRDDWRAAINAIAGLLRTTRTDIDQVYRVGADSFVILLPESGPEAVRGLVRRLRSTTDLPTQYGAAFYPDSATTVEALIRCATVAAKLAAKEPTRLYLHGAEAPEEPAPDSMRSRGREEEESILLSEVRA